MSTIHPRRRLPLALVTGALLTLGATLPAGAAKAPAFVLNGGDHWFTHDVGWYQVVQGPAELQIGKRTLTGTLSATISPDDHTMPGPGACETGITFVFVEGNGAADTFISSAGEICGYYVQPPTSVVTHVFTGEATIEESGSKRLEGKTGFLEVRLAEDGRAHVFATAQ
jgi:hypothetical protein